MKLGYLFYWCGWGLIVGAFIFIGMGIFTEEGFSTFVIAKIISSFFFGLAWLFVGSKKIARARQSGDLGQLRKVLQESQEQFTTFQKENCVGCKFADEVTMRNFTAWNFKKWCLRPELPEFSKDSKWCYSREVTKG